MAAKLELNERAREKRTFDTIAQNLVRPAEL